MVDLAILRVAGTLALDNTSSLVLAGGLKTSNTIVAVGTTTKVGQSATLNGGIVSASGTCAFDLSTTVNGIVACAAGVSATNGVTFNYVAPAF